MHAYTASFIAAAISLLSVQMVPAPEAALPLIGAVTGGVSMVTGLEGQDSGGKKRNINPGNAWSDLFSSTHSVSGSVFTGDQLYNMRPVGKRQAPASGTAEADCKTQLAGAHLRFSQPVHTTVQVEGIPPACMTVMAVLNGKIHQGNPVPMGTDSIQFTNMSDSDLKLVEDALNIHQGQ